MKKLINILSLVLLSAVMVGCSSFGGGDNGTASNGTAGTNGAANGATTTGIDGGATFSGHVLDDPSSPLSTKVIYFEFDSSAIAPQYEAVVAAHAAYLAANSSVSIVLEGHTDERGTREYNVALSENRAKSVLDLLSLQGVTGKQVNITAYGEEKPAALSHDEQSWQLNRRVELVYPAH